jgi:hypothetical protein
MGAPPPRARSAGSTGAEVRMGRKQGRGGNGTWTVSRGEREGRGGEWSEKGGQGAVGVAEGRAKAAMRGAWSEMRSS